MLVRKITVDVNECDSDPGPCADICTNTIGSFRCSCSGTGQYLTDDGNCVGNEYVIIRM